MNFQSETVRRQQTISTEIGRLALKINQLSLWMQETEKTFFSLKLTVKAGSGDPEPSLSYAAIRSGCWVASHDALSTYSPFIFGFSGFFSFSFY